MRIFAVVLVSLVAAASIGQNGINRWPPNDPKRPHPRVIFPGTESSQHKAGLPPSDAIVLFKGGGLSEWESVKGGPAKWKVANGVVEVVPKSGDIRTKRRFGDCQVHLEWMTPALIQGSDQGRGNSGVWLMSLYEVQILDSYNNKTYADGQAAALYAQYPPLVNASRQPGQWQSYDIVFHRPRFGPRGNVLSPARFTVFHNGVLAQDNEPLVGPTAFHKRPPYAAHPDRLPLMLQDHGNKVRFRNVWVRDLEAGKR